MAIVTMPTSFAGPPSRLEKLVGDFATTLRADVYAAAEELEEAIGALLADGSADLPVGIELFAGGLPPAAPPPGLAYADESPFQAPQMDEILG
jgi:hypothetical protein